MGVPEKIGEYERVIAAAAWTFHNAAEYDDLYQEGMIAVWRCPPDADPQYINRAIYNRMKNWVRYVKRLRHNHSVSYEEIVEGIQQEYSNDSVENMLRNYYSLQDSSDTTLAEYKADLDLALTKLKDYSSVLYSTIVNVFINSKPINVEAYDSGVSRMQVNRRLHDALHMLTMIMNGEIL